MALQPIPGGLLIPTPTPFAASGNFAYGNMGLTAASHRAAAILQVPKTGSVRKVLWRTGSVTTGATMEVRIETVDPATGDPSGILADAGAFATQNVTTADANTVFRTQLGADVGLTRGDVVALVIQNPAGSPGSMNISQLSNSIWRAKFPYGDLYTTAWAKQQDIPCMALEYADGSFSPSPGILPYGSVGYTAFNNASSPDERGLKFQLPFAARLRGLWLYASNTGNYDVVLYDAQDAVLKTLSIPSGYGYGTSGGIQHYLLASSQDLAANAWYRLVLKPTTATSITAYHMIVDTGAEAILDALPGGQNFHFTERTDGGAWTDRTTQVPALGLLLDAFDDGQGAAVGHGTGPQVVLAATRPWK